MADEKVTKQELNLEELDAVAGGVAEGEPTPWTCMFCGNTITIHSNTEATNHVKTCQWNPRNRK